MKSQIDLDSNKLKNYFAAISRGKCEISKEDVLHLKNDNFTPSDNDIDSLFKKVCLFSLDYKNGIKETDFLHLMIFVHSNNMCE